VAGKDKPPNRGLCQDGWGKRQHSEWSLCVAVICVGGKGHQPENPKKSDAKDGLSRWVVAAGKARLLSGRGTFDLRVRVLYKEKRSDSPGGDPRDQMRRVWWFQKKINV